ncbi:hypothetical protein EFK07_22235 [Pseudomonas putida]|uniref:Uncharacterized protein n=1 Tax=Pseudomonas putida TaxID=303 RepID=A0A3M8STE1_PSEPU|nr:hypothetical protein EFK07_22235 [Pseudomonas putida]
MIGRLCRPLRGHARSHRYCTACKAAVIPVGAGSPAKRPAQATHQVRNLRTSASSSLDNPARLSESIRAAWASSATSCASP